MAVANTTWGSNAGGSNPHQVGIGWTISGRTATVRFYVRDTYNNANDDQRLNLGGVFSGHVDFHNGGGETLVATRSHTGSYGGSFTVSATLTGVYTGGNPSHSRTVTIPAIPPSAPSRPSVSNVTDTGARVSWSAPASNGASIDDYQVRIERGGSVVLVDNTGTARSRTWGSGLDPRTQYGARVRAHNSAGWGGWSDFRYFTTEMVAPDPQTNVSASRVSDGRVDLSWTLNGKSAAPYEGQQVQRQVNGGSWSVRANLPASAPSYTDTSTSAGNAYRYRVRASNEAGFSSFAYSPTVYMTPNGPSSPVTATKQSGGDIKVSWPASTSDYTTSYAIYDAPDSGSTEDLVQVGTTSGTSWTHTSPDPAKTHRYRVTARYGSLESSYSVWSNTVQLQAPPLAPTLLSPADGGVLPNDGDVSLRWRHNPVDTTEQTAWELRYRVDGGSWVTESGTTEDAWILPAPDASGTYEWQVRTKGQDPSFSPWSTVSTFTLASVPSVAIQSPVGPTLTQAHVTVTWTYQNADGGAQATWQVELLDADGLTLEQGSGSGAATEYAFDARLEDATSYTVRVRVRSGDGLWSTWDEVSFDTDFPLPATIAPGLEWDRATAAVSVTLATEPIVPEEGQAVPDAVDVERRDAGGQWVLIGSGLDPMTSITDPTPRLGEVEYRIISRTVLPSEAVGPVETITWDRRNDGPSVFVNGGTDMGMVCTAQGGQRSNDPSIEQSAVRFAGQSHPTALFGTGQDYALSFTGKIIHYTAPDGTTTIHGGVSSREEWEALLAQFGIVCYRDTTGMKTYGILTAGFSMDKVVEQVSLSIQRTRYVEGVQRVADEDLGQQ